MKLRIPNNEMSPGRADLVIWRRCDRGFWFVVQTASLASERRNQRLVRRLRAESVFGNPFLGRTGHRPVPSGDSPDGMATTPTTNGNAVIPIAGCAIPVGESPTATGESPVLPIFKTRSDRFSIPSLQSLTP